MLETNAYWVRMVFILAQALFLFAGGVPAFLIFPRPASHPFTEYRFPQIGSEWEDTFNGMGRQLKMLAENGETGLARQELMERLEKSLIGGSRYFIPGYIQLFFTLVLYIRFTVPAYGAAFLFTNRV